MLATSFTHTGTEFARLKLAVFGPVCAINLLFSLISVVDQYWPQSRSDEPLKGDYTHTYLNDAVGVLLGALVLVSYI
jgi:hypothetical protein